MHWLQVSVDGMEPSAVEDLLFELGAQAVSLTTTSDEQILEPPPGATPLWDKTRVTGLFAPETDPEPILDAIERTFGAAAQCGASLLEDREWVRAWMDHFRPIRFGERLWVCPSGFELDEPDAVIVRLDPGLAFGTGTHPSTALCLKWLDAHDCSGKTVIDYGCGSGILAVTAARLGARIVHAVDIDPQAITATRSNAALNGVGAKVTVGEPGMLGGMQADILLANILAGPLRLLAPRLTSLVKPGGAIVLAGLLESQAADVRDAYLPFAPLDEAATEDGWTRLSGRSKSG